MANKNNSGSREFVEWFRASSPYIHAHRKRTFVIVFGGAAVADSAFPNLIHDIALLNSLGIRVVLVHGARPQIESRLKARGASLEYVNGLRVTDEAALGCVKEAAGSVRVEIEALLSMGLTNSPMAHARIRVASGNFVTARPLGVHDGVDYCHTGVVRRVDVEAITQRLDDGAIVVLPPLGYSPTGEVFNLSAHEVAAAVAAAIGADKLICLADGKGVTDGRGRIIDQLTPTQAEQLGSSKRKLAEDVGWYLEASVRACRAGVRRSHIINWQVDGALLLELFTRDGAGTLVTSGDYEEVRDADVEDIGGILELIKPLEDAGLLLRRSREFLEMEINSFSVIERDGMIIACAALHLYLEEQVGEIACVAVHPGYQDQGRAATLLELLERKAVRDGIKRLLVLTTRAEHWFRERGYRKGDLNKLPVKKRSLYNFQRNSKVFIKPL